MKSISGISFKDAFDGSLCIALLAFFITFPLMSCRPTSTDDSNLSFENFNINDEKDSLEN